MLRDPTFQPLCLVVMLVGRLRVVLTSVYILGRGLKSLVDPIAKAGVGVGGPHAPGSGFVGEVDLSTS